MLFGVTRGACVLASFGLLLCGCLGGGDDGDGTVATQEDGGMMGGQRPSGRDLTPFTVRDGAVAGPTDAGGDGASGASDAGTAADAGSSGDGSTNDAGDTEDAGSPDAGGESVCGDGRVEGNELCEPSVAACCNETCNGLRPNGTPCRAARAACDAAELCDGVSAACPPDRLQPAGVVCRSAADACDLPEICDGASASCPDPVAHCALTDLGSTMGADVAVSSTAGSCDLFHPSCAIGVEGSSPEAVYSFTAPVAGDYVVDTFGSSYDTVLLVLESLSCDARQLACNDDVGAQYQSQVGLSLDDGQQVFIVVDGYDDSGDFRLSIHRAEPAQCCSVGTLPGCRDVGITSCVCAADYECCVGVWDQLCVDAASEACGACL